MPTVTTLSRLVLSATLVAMFGTTTGARGAPGSVSCDHPLYGPEDRFFVEWEASDVTAADLNGDGHLDLISVGRNQVMVFLNQGDATFGPPLITKGAYGPSAVVAARVNGDDRVDLIAASRDLVRVYPNDGDATFDGSIPLLYLDERASDAVGVDMDGDGDLDIVTTNTIPDGVSVLLNDGTGTIAAQPFYETGDYPVALASADLDGDLDPDIVVANQFTDDISVLLNQGDGSLAPEMRFPCGEYPRYLAIGDLDGDLDIDVVTTNRDSVDMTVLFNQGDGSLGAPVSYLSGTSLGDVAIGDVDGDLDRDLLVVGGGEILLLPNDGAGTFGAPISIVAAAAHITLGDVDGDLDLDLLVTGTSHVTVLPNDGGGNFGPGIRYETQAENDYARHPMLADLDGDANLDVIVTTENSNSFAVLRNDGAGGFEGFVKHWLFGMHRGPVVGDMTGDGVPDLVTTNPGLFIAAGNGDTTFKAPRSYDIPGGLDVVVSADFDVDGDEDIAVLTDESQFWVLHNDGAGVHRERHAYPTGVAPRTLSTGDLNGDGAPDIAIANAAAVSVLLNDGTGAFPTRDEYATGIGSQRVAIGDIEGDGDLDLAVANHTSSDVSLLFNHGDGTFGPEERLAIGASPRAIAAAYVNGDAHIDLVLTNWSGGGNIVTVALNNGEGTFGAEGVYGVDIYPDEFTLGDFDADHVLDIATVNTAYGSISVLLNECAVCVGDIDDTGEVSFSDVISILGAWGPCGVCAADLNFDGAVNFRDLLLVISHWGPCK